MVSLYGRWKKLPPLPTSLDKALEQLRLMTNENLHKQEKFCFVHKGTPIFTTQNNLQLLFQSDFIFRDGTFTYSPKYFYQMYTIHAYMTGYYVPIIYAFLRSKEEGTYLEMWEGNKNISYNFFILSVPRL